MNKTIRNLLLGCALVVAPVSSMEVQAQQSSVQETRDQEAIAELQSLVTWSADMLAEIGNLINAANDQNTSLNELITDGQTRNQTLADNLGAVTGNNKVTAPTYPAIVGDLSRRGILFMAHNLINTAKTSDPVDLDILTELKQYYAIDEISLNVGRGTNTPNSPIKAQAHNAAMGVAALAISHRAYNHARGSEARLLGHINELVASPDIKTSLDINTMVMIEVGMQLNQVVRTLSAQTAVAGSTAVSGESSHVNVRRSLNLNDVFGIK